MVEQALYLLLAKTFFKVILTFLTYIILGIFIFICYTFNLCTFPIYYQNILISTF